MSSTVLNQPQVSDSKKYFPALTGIRAIAAFLVFFHHFNPFISHSSPKLSQSFMINMLGAFVAQWHIGVSIFFVLSGLLIAMRYADRAEFTRAWFKQYFLNRFARIYPVYFLLTVITFVGMALRHTYSWYEWQKSTTIIDKTISLIANLTLSRSLFHNFYLLGIPTAWTLTVEECFYVSAPLLLLILRKKPNILPVTALVLICTGLLLTSVSTAFNLYGSFMRPISFMLTNTYFGRCVEFLVGIGLAMFLKKNKNLYCKVSATLLGGLFIMLCIIGMVICAWNYVPSDVWPSSIGAIIINNYVLPFCVAFLFYGLITEKTFFRIILESKFFDILGKSSYVFYLLHFGLFSDLFIQTFGNNIAILFIFMNCLSVLIYKLIEHPVQSYIVNKFRSLPVKISN